jgi:hypothetical protein
MAAVLAQQSTNNGVKGGGTMAAWYRTTKVIWLWGRYEWEKKTGRMRIMAVVQFDSAICL